MQVRVLPPLLDNLPAAPDVVLPTMALGIPTIVESARLDDCLRPVVAQEWIVHDVVIICNGPEPRRAAVARGGAQRNGLG